MIPSIASSADISLTKFVGDPTIFINGVIAEGDYSKFLQVAAKALESSNKLYRKRVSELQKKDPDAYKKWFDENGGPKGIAHIRVELNSQGGDVAEAIKIGRAVRDMLFTTSVFGYRVSDDKSELSKCMSACFLIWISGAERFAFSENNIGIHRLYFNPEKYKNVSSKKAEVEYKKLQITAKEYLQEMGAPEIYFTKMLNTPSNDVYLLKQEEIDVEEGELYLRHNVCFHDSSADPMLSLSLLRTHRIARPLTTNHLTCCICVGLTDHVQ